MSKFNPGDRVKRTHKSNVIEMTVGSEWEVVSTDAAGNISLVYDPSPYAKENSHDWYEGYFTIVEKAEPEMKSLFVVDVENFTAGQIAEALKAANIPARISLGYDHINGYTREKINWSIEVIPGGFVVKPL